MKTPYTDLQMHKIARAVTWMIEHEYWKDHFIWERDAAITDICLKYFTFNDCNTVCYIIRFYLRKLLENTRYNGLNFTRRQDQIRNGLLLTIPVSELEHNIDLTPRNVQGVSCHPDKHKTKTNSISFSTKFKEHFGLKNTRDDWNLYQREKRYFDSYKLCSWENPNYSIVPKKKTGKKSKKKPDRELVSETAGVKNMTNQKPFQFLSGNQAITNIHNLKQKECKFIFWLYMV